MGSRPIEPDPQLLRQRSCKGRKNDPGIDPGDRQYSAIWSFVTFPKHPARPTSQPMKPGKAYENLKLTEVNGH
jgi:hypothetical protein